MPGDSSQTSDLLCRAVAGDGSALSELFSRYRERLKRMVRLRLNRRLHGHVDESEVLEEAWRGVAHRLEEYLRQPECSFFLWLRSITGQTLTDVHRRHLGAQCRDSIGEVSLCRGAFPAASSAALAAHLLGRLTSPLESLRKNEMKARVQQVLDQLDPLDREVLVLRHFEQLTNAETAQVLELTDPGASSRYLRALKRMKDLLAEIPGFFETR